MAFSDTIRPVTDQSKATHFLSDAHLGSGPDQDRRVALLLEFLAVIRNRTTHLYILGDLFDFWFEYRHAIPKGHFRVLRALADLIASGAKVSYFGGNHDFWCGSYLASEVGLDVHQEPLALSLDQRRLYLAHGDGIGPGDRGYHFLKAVLRNRLAIALYRTIHPDLGIPLAYRVSAISRQHTRGRVAILAYLKRHLAIPRYAAGDDAIVIGHVHDPLHLRDEQGRDFLIIGDWMENFTFVELEQGRFRLNRYLGDGQFDEIAPIAWPDASPAKDRAAGRSDSHPPETPRPE